MIFRILTSYPLYCDNASPKLVLSLLSSPQEDDTRETEDTEIQ